MRNWEEGIFNFFHARHTNAYTESANAQVKGYSGRAPRAKLTTISAKVIHGPQLEQQRKALREKGKVPQRRAPHTQELTPSPTVTSASNTPEPPRASEAQMSHPASKSAALAEVGPRLDLAKIAAPRRKSGKGKDSASPLSPQMSLFE